jgi:O-antigen/teichoic acid export membrane protein
MKTKEILLKVSFFVFLIITLIGAFLNIYHWNEAGVIIAIGSFISICFIVLSLLEVVNSDTISQNEKTMWIVGLIVITPIAGLIYIVSGRKRILKNK